MINISISTNVLIVISCITLMVIIGIIVYIIYKDKKTDQEEIDDLIEDIVNAKPRTEVKPEVKQIKEEKEIDNNSLNLEEMLNTMQQDLDKKEEKAIDEFEKEQEENAIISYKELKKAAYKVDEFEKEQEENAIISYKSLNKKSSAENLTEKEDLFKSKAKKPIVKIESPRENKDKKFKNTEFISPIFGKMDEHIEYPKIKAYNKEDDLSLNEYFGEDVEEYYKDEKEVLNVEPLKGQMKKNDDFLKALKEFRNNL
jgi:hypothetical protein